MVATYIILIFSNVDQPKFVWLTLIFFQEEYYKILIKKIQINVQSHLCRWLDIYLEHFKMMRAGKVPDIQPRDRIDVVI